MFATAHHVPAARDSGEDRAGTFYRAVGAAYSPLGTITTIVLPPR